MSLVKVERNLFFKVQGGGSLRFVEHAPASAFAEDEHHDCGCTTTVRARPAGTPSQVQQEFYIEDENASLRLIGLDGPWLTFGKFGSDDEHAYFMFNKNERSVRVEITLPDYGLTDCFFAHLYLGNAIDISRFMNGHSPSRIVDLSKIDAQQLWAHGCSFGSEAMRFFSDAAEIEKWREVLHCATEIGQRVGAYNLDRSSTVEALRARLEADNEILDHAAKLKALLTPIVDIKSTEMFRLCSEIDREIHPSLPEEERASWRAKFRTIRTGA